MSELSLGIKELKEALVGVNELAIFIAMRLKDGIGLDDAMAIWSKLSSDEEFKQKMVAAYDGISQVPAEIKDLDLAEGMAFHLADVYLHMSRIVSHHSTALYLLPASIAKVSLSSTSLKKFGQSSKK